jgi:choice-of-anchor C domain-containing protein
MHRSLFLFLALTASMSQAGDFSFFIEDVRGLGSAGTGYYNPGGLTGDIFGRPELPFLTMPGPGPLTGLTPRVAAIFQYRIDPSTMTPDDLAPAEYPAITFQYSTMGSVNVDTAPIGGNFTLPLRYEFDFSGTPTGPQWVQGKPNNGQDVWVYNTTILNSSTSGFGIVALATTDTTGLGGLGSSAISVPITGGQGRTTYQPTNYQCMGGDGKNLLMNGSFEERNPPTTVSHLEAGVGDKSITGWTIEENSIDHVFTYWPASDGLFSIDMSGAMFGVISQTIPTVPGKLYEVRFDLAGNPYPGQSTDIRSVQFEVAGTTNRFDFDITGHSFTDMGWETNCFAFVATSTSETLRLRGLNWQPTGAAIDNVGVYAVPDSTSLLSTIDVRLDDFGPSGVMGYRFNGTETIYGSAGQFRFDTKNPIGSAAQGVSPNAVGFCIELTQDFSSDFHTYNVGDLTLAQDPVGISGPISPEQAALIEQLWALHYDADWPDAGPFSFADITRSMAFGALLYEIIYDFDGVSLASMDLDSGLFQLVDGFLLDKNDPTQELPVFDVASFFLGTLSLNYTGPRPQLLALTNAAQQDYLVAVVPEVGTFPLVSAVVVAFGGISLARRLRKEAK